MLSRRDDREVQTVVTDALADAVRFTPGNALLFFPSYGEAERYADLLAGEVDYFEKVRHSGTDVEITPSDADAAWVVTGSPNNVDLLLSTDVQAALKKA